MRPLPLPLPLAGCLALLATAPSAQVLTTRVSVDSNGLEAAEESFESDLSADGRYVVFTSKARLDPRDLNFWDDVYRHDRQTGVTELVSVSTSNQAGNSLSNRPSISADGRWVTFDSQAFDLVVGDTNDLRDVFLRDMNSGAMALISRGPGGVLGNGDSAAPDVSEDGLWVSFQSNASNLLSTPDTNAGTDVFLYHRPSALLAMVSITPSGAPGGGPSREPAISGDGAFVVFSSRATDLVSADTNGVEDVFRHEVATGKTIRVSVDSSGNEGNGDSDQPDISADGQRVVYESLATNLVPGDTNGFSDVFGYLVPLKSTLRISVGPGGVQATERSGTPRISGDGTRVAFDSLAANLVAGDTNSSIDVFLVDLGSLAMLRVSLDSMGNQGTLSSLDAGIDSQGHVVSYRTRAAFPGDTNGVYDIYVSDPAPGGRNYCTPGTSASGCQVSLGTSGTPSLSLGSGFTITAGAIEGSKDGIFFFGTNGRQANGWGNGSSFQCVVPPVKRTGLQTGGGTNGSCNGSASLDFNAWMAANPGRAPGAGILSQIQFWYRDPGNTSNQTTSLSDAIEFVVAP